MLHLGINLTADSNQGQLDAYIKSAEWDLESNASCALILDRDRFHSDFTAVNDALKYDCCPTLYPFVLYTLQIRRRSMYYFTNIVGENNRAGFFEHEHLSLLVPCFLISCMTILGFALAPDSGEKLTLRKWQAASPHSLLSLCLEITILLSVIMFSLLMSEILPPSSAAVPIITKYFLCIMVMSTISVMASVLVISIHYRNAKIQIMPMWVSAASHHTDHSSEVCHHPLLRFASIFVTTWHGSYS